MNAQAHRPYRVELSELAVLLARRLPEAEWKPLARELSWVAELAGRLPPPAQEVLESAGFNPPFFRLPVGTQLALYEFDHPSQTMRVLALVRLKEGADPARRPMNSAPAAT